MSTPLQLIRVELWQKLAGHRIPLTQADRLVPMLRFFALMCCALYPARIWIS